MERSVIDHLMETPKMLHFAPVPELSSQGWMTYRMDPDYGSGFLRMSLVADSSALVVVGDYAPLHKFEKIDRVADDYIEISQLETESSTFQVGMGKPVKIERGIYCHVNTDKTTSTYCEAGHRTCFTKVVLSAGYFDQRFRERFGAGYELTRDMSAYLMANAKRPELNFIFQQMRECEATDPLLGVYLESKLAEMMSIVVDGMRRRPTNAPIRLTAEDLRNLKRAHSTLKRDLARTPSIDELARAARMGSSRFHVVFRERYGSSPYQYLKQLRMNRSLQLLRRRDLSIAQVASRLGYSNAGHFAGLFRETYGMTPREYRKMYCH